jgi:hypothetical protein
MAGQTRSQRRYALGFLAFALIVSSLLGLGAQEMLQLGNMTYARAAAPSLAIPVSRGARFFRGVGGVAFNAVARGEGGLQVQSLRYDAGAPDGQRLVVNVVAPGGAPQTARGGLYDWELVPIARFAADANGSAMTLFGELADREHGEEITAAGGRVINYHETLADTLVGLRLMQADILVFQRNAAHLFTRNGRVILGPGEHGHDAAANLRRFDALMQWQDAAQKRGNRYVSYVVGDLTRQVTFSLDGESLSFTGKPYWALWRNDDRREALVDRHDALVDELRRDASRLAENVDRLTPAQQRVAMARFEGRRNELTRVRAEVDALDGVVQLPVYSAALTAEVERLDGVNPIVYRMLTRVMHYRALFKHAQQRNPAGYTRFVASLARVPMTPAVETPTIQVASR